MNYWCHFYILPIKIFSFFLPFGMQYLSPQPRIKPTFSVLEEQSLNDWTTKEVVKFFFFFLRLFFSYLSIDFNSHRKEVTICSFHISTPILKQVCMDTPHGIVCSTDVFIFRTECRDLTCLKMTLMWFLSKYSFSFLMVV